jgi:hypothetical protein
MEDLMAGPRRCEAFTKSFRACRNYADHASGLCTKHAAFYTDTWLKFLLRNYMPLTWGPTNTSSLEKARLIAGHRAIQPDLWPASRVEEMLLEHSARATDTLAGLQVLALYEVLCLERRIRPSRLPSLWFRTVGRYTEILTHMISAGVHHERLQMHARQYYLLPFVQSMEDLTMYLGCLPAFLRFLPPVALQTMPVLIPMLLELLHGQIGTDMTFADRQGFLAETEQRWQKTAGEHPDTAGVFRAWSGEVLSMVRFFLSELYKKDKQRMRDSCERYKETLMMVAWHPDRVLRLMEAGIDPCDM